MTAPTRLTSDNPVAHTYNQRIIMVSREILTVVSGRISFEKSHCLLKSFRFVVIEILPYQEEVNYIAIGMATADEKMMEMYGTVLLY